MGLFGFRRASQRRDPWPYDIVVTKSGVQYGYVLGSEKPGAPLIVSIPPPLRGMSGLLDYSAQDPTVENTFAWTDWVLGMGQRTQHGNADRRYYYALGVDASVGRQLIPGPAISSPVTPTTVDSTNGISHFFERSIGGTDTLFALNGRYCQYRVNDNTWSVSKDFGLGKVALDVIVVQQISAGSSQYTMVAMGDSEKYWYHDGASATTTWSQHATDYALAWAIKGNELFRAADVNGVAKVNLVANPLNSGNWTSLSNWRLGDYKQPVVRLRINAAGTLVAFKRETIHVLDQDGNDILLYPGLDYTPSAENGRYAFLSENWLYATYNGIFFRLGPDMSMEPIGPEKDSENESEVHGYITAGVWTPFGVYAGLYNPDNGNSYLMKLGAFPLSEGDPAQIDVWHGSLCPALQGKKLTAMHISQIGAPAGHRRLYMGFSDGSICHFTLPCTPNPTACSSYAFATAGTIYPSQWHGGFPADQKTLRAMSATATSASSTRTLRVSLDPNLSGSYSVELPLFASVPGKRNDIVGTAQSTILSQKWDLNRDSGSSGPVITGVAVHYHLAPQPIRVYRFMVLADDGLVRNDMAALKEGADRIRQIWRSILQERSAVSVQWPDTRTDTVHFIEMEEDYAWDNRTRQWRAALRLRGVQGDVAANAELSSSGGIDL